MKLLFLVLISAILSACSKSPTTGTATSASSSEAKSAAPVAKSLPTAAPESAAEAQEAAEAEPEEEGPIVVLGRVVGSAGQTVRVSATLQRGKEEIAAISTDIHYDPKDARVVLDDQGQPLCEASVGVGKGSEPAKQVLAKERLIGDDEAVLRVALLGMDNANPLPDGELFTCRFRIADTAAAGEKVLRATSSGAGQTAQAVTVLESESAIVVN